MSKNLTIKYNIIKYKLIMKLSSINKLLFLILYNFIFIYF